MKKLSVIIISLVLTMSVFAQEVQENNYQSQDGLLRNKKGYVIVPEQGDIGISINAAPFLSYAGNFFNGANVAPNVLFTAQNPGSISLKYVFTETMIIRGTLKVGSTKNTTNIPNFTDPKLFDKAITSSTTFGLSAGVQILRPIKNRLMGYYGGVIGYDVIPNAAGKITFKDAKDKKNDNVTKGGNTSTIYIGGLIGAEYFVAPKISVGGELLLNVGFNSISKRETVFKNNSSLDNVISEKSSGMSIGTLPSGSITASFYF